MAVMEGAERLKPLTLERLKSKVLDRDEVPTAIGPAIVKRLGLSGKCRAVDLREQFDVDEDGTFATTEEGLRYAAHLASLCLVDENDAATFDVEGGPEALHDLLGMEDLQRVMRKALELNGIGSVSDDDDDEDDGGEVGKKKSG